MKLRLLPQPDRFFLLMPLSVQSEILNFTLNRIFEEESIKRLHPLQGKQFIFRTPAGEINLQMSVGDDKVLIRKPETVKADVTIEGDVLALFSLCFGLEDPDSLFFSRRLLLTGDTAAGLLFKNVLANIDFDLKQEMESRLGSSLTRVLWDMVPASIQQVEKLDHWLTGARNSILKQSGMSNREEVQDLKKHISKLEKTFDSLNKRLDQLEKRPRKQRRAESLT